MNYSCFLLQILLLDPYYFLLKKSNMFLQSFYCLLSSAKSDGFEVASISLLMGPTSA